MSRDGYRDQIVNMSVDSSFKQCDVGFVSSFQDTPMSDLVSCSFSTIPLLIQTIFPNVCSPYTVVHDCTYRSTQRN